MNRKNELIDHWIRFAEEDLKVAKSIVVADYYSTHNIVFLSQQASEKVIKAFLIKYEISFRKTHDLNKLISFIEDQIEVSGSLYQKINIFEKFSVEVRYPDGELIPTKEDAYEAFINAEWIFNHFKEKLI